MDTPIFDIEAFVEEVLMLPLVRLHLRHSKMFDKVFIETFKKLLPNDMDDNKKQILIEAFNNDNDAKRLFIDLDVSRVFKQHHTSKFEFGGCYLERISAKDLQSTDEQCHDQLLDGILAIPIVKTKLVEKQMDEKDFVEIIKSFLPNNLDEEKKQILLKKFSDEDDLRYIFQEIELVKKYDETFSTKFVFGGCHIKMIFNRETLKRKAEEDVNEDPSKRQKVDAIPVDLIRVYFIDSFYTKDQIKQNLINTYQSCFFFKLNTIPPIPAKELSKETLMIMNNMRISGKRFKIAIGLDKEGLVKWQSILKELYSYDSKKRLFMIPGTNQFYGNYFPLEDTDVDFAIYIRNEVGDPLWYFTTILSKMFYDNFSTFAPYFLNVRDFINVILHFCSLEINMPKLTDLSDKEKARITSFKKTMEAVFFSEECSFRVSNNIIYYFDKLNNKCSSYIYMPLLYRLCLAKKWMCRNAGINQSFQGEKTTLGYVFRPVSSHLITHENDAFRIIHNMI